jgi:bifunctional DNase/RNase
MIQVKVEQLFLSNVGFVVILKGESDPRSLPVFIGPAEAQAIAIAMGGVKVPRPLTHDLMKNLLDQQECRLKRIEVCDLREGTFYGKLVLDRDNEEFAVDSRPSDAIALALRFGAPMFVHKAVLEEAGQVIQKQQAEGEAAAPEAEKKTEMTPLDQIKRELAKAIKDERYEDAARLRDEIKRLEDPHAHN